MPENTHPGPRVGVTGVCWAKTAGHSEVVGKGRPALNKRRWAFQPDVLTVREQHEINVFFFANCTIHDHFLSGMQIKRLFKRGGAPPPKRGDSFFIFQVGWVIFWPDPLPLGWG